MLFLHVCLSIRYGVNIDGCSISYRGLVLTRYFPFLVLGIEGSSRPEANPYGPTVNPEEAPEAITQAVASLPPEQMFELMKQMKVNVLETDKIDSWLLGMIILGRRCFSL